MKYTVKYTAKFKKDYKQAQKQGLNTDKLLQVVALIASGTEQEKLRTEYDDHALVGNWKGYRECHIESDWILIYELLENILVLSLSRTGTHSKLLNK